MTFTHEGEAALHSWMSEHALVAWKEHPQPWLVEGELLKRVSCPLNIDANGHHPYQPVLRALRAAALSTARTMPIA